MKRAIPNIVYFIFDIAVLQVVFVRFFMGHHRVAHGHVEEKIEKTVRVRVVVVKNIGVQLAKCMEKRVVYFHRMVVFILVFHGIDFIIDPVYCTVSKI